MHFKYYTIIERILQYFLRHFDIFKRARAYFFINVGLFAHFFAGSMLFCACPAYNMRFFAQTFFMEKIKNSPGNEKKGKKIIVKLAVGAVCGAINGFFGGGGGMLVVPMLAGILGYEQKRAQASCIAVILPVSVASGVVYAFTKDIPWVSFIPVCIGVAIGGAVGAWLLKRIKSKALGYAFCAVMIAAGLKTIF